MYYFVIAKNDNDNIYSPECYVDVNLKDYYIKTKQKEIHNHINKMLQKMYDGQYIVSNAYVEEEFMKLYNKENKLKRIDYDILKKQYDKYLDLWIKYRHAANDLEKFQKKISS